MQSLTHDELIDIGRAWCLRSVRGGKPGGHSACSLVLTDMTSYARETPDVLGWHSGGSLLIECKASASDFKADARKQFRRYPDTGVGARRYYLAPKGLLTVDALPDTWGLLEAVGSRVYITKVSGTFVSNHQAEVTMLLSLIRRTGITPGKHMAIRAYVHDSPGFPRATVTLRDER